MNNILDIDFYNNPSFTFKIYIMNFPKLFLRRNEFISYYEKQDWDKPLFEKLVLQPRMASPDTVVLVGWAIDINKQLMNTQQLEFELGATHEIPIPFNMGNLVIDKKELQQHIGPYNRVNDFSALEFEAFVGDKYYICYHITTDKKMLASRSANPCPPLQCTAIGNE